MATSPHETALVRFERLLDAASNALAWLGVAALMAMMVHVTVDVLSKLLLGRALVGTIEMVSTYYMIGCVFGPLALVQQRREHIAVDFFTDRMRPRLAHAAGVLALFLMLLVVALLAWSGFDVAFDQTQARETTSSTTAQFQIWPTRWIPVAAYALTVAYLTIELIRSLVKPWVG